MVQIDVSPEELATLRETLENVIAELRYEINDTDAKDYREKLKRKLELLKRVAGQLSAG